MSIKDIIVTTTPTLEGWEITEYIKPISAHLVAGTNFFSDFAASFSDVFGGRSNSYQRQISSLYNDAVEQLKFTAHQFGANCILALTVDMDEISGKGKSMFMITAIGTAVRVQKTKNSITDVKHTYSSNITVEELHDLNKKQNLIEKASNNSLELTDNVWMFIKEHKVHELFDFIMDKWKLYIESDSPSFYKNILEYVDALPVEVKYHLIYSTLIKGEGDLYVKHLSTLIRDLQLLDLDLVKEYLSSSDFLAQKRALVPLLYDKVFYNEQDIDKYNEILQIIKNNFNERGQRSTKKQLLSSKEKEVWICECGKQNDIGERCTGCGSTIHGFKHNEVTPTDAIAAVETRIDLIKKLLNQKQQNQEWNKMPQPSLS